MKKVLKAFLYLLGGIFGLILAGWIIFQLFHFVRNLSARSRLQETAVLRVDGLAFRDLNKNGSLDVYEDFRQSLEDRVSDLLARMTLEEKIGLMFHPIIGIGNKGRILGKPRVTRGSLLSTYDALINKHINTYNFYIMPPVAEMATWHNRLQRLAEQTRLGIPVLLSSDPRHGYSEVAGASMMAGDFSQWPEPIGLAATRDSNLVRDFARIVNREYRAVGIRLALHPMADIATEPRWARINGTFGEDGRLVTTLTAAYISGLQGDTLGPQSVSSLLKHFPGAGPQQDGLDAHFPSGKYQAYPGNNFEYHLEPFKSLLRQFPHLQIMPYYAIPLDQTAENVGMAFNKGIIDSLLRTEMGFDGIICADWLAIGMKLFNFIPVDGKMWGVEHLTTSQRIRKAIAAGVDQFGGNDNTPELIKLVREGEIPVERINQSARRILAMRFRLGLFENPYVDEQEAPAVVGNPAFKAAGLDAQRRSLVLLKNTFRSDSTRILPLTGKERIFLENIDLEVAARYGKVVDSLRMADVAIIRLSAPFIQGPLQEKSFHQGDLDFKEPELSRILHILRTKPTIVCIYLDRPAVIPAIAASSAALLANFGASDEVLLDIIYGRHAPSGKLPFEMPSSMEAVYKQQEDVPFDSQSPLFPYGWGLEY